MFFSNTKPRGKLRTLQIDLEGEGEMNLGAATVEDLTWKEILDTYSCTECGRCQNACPAWNTGKPLSPKLVIMNLRDHLFEKGPEILSARRAGREYEKEPLNPNVIEDEVLWDPDDPMLRPRQAARLLGVEPRTVSNWARLGLLEARRTAGGHHRFGFGDGFNVNRKVLYDFDDSIGGQARFCFNRSALRHVINLSDIHP